MKYSNQLICILCLLLLGACKQEYSTKIVDTNGYWTSVGYGRVLKVIDGAYNLYDVTSISCIEVLEGNLSDYGDALTITQDTLALKDGINMYYFTRFNDIPALCNQDDLNAKANDPEYNFEVLAETFKNEYAYFELRQVNWDAMYKRYRSKVTSNTSSAELYRIMEDMLNEFNDGHIGLEAPEEIEEAAALLVVADTGTEKSVNTSNIKRYGNHEVSNLVARKYVENLQSRANKMLQWGRINDTIGYVQINQMFGFGDYKLADSLSGRDYWMAYFEKAEASTTEEHTKKEMDGISAIMDEVMSDLKSTKSIIIDVRFNGGGKDEVGLEVMSRFNANEQLVFTKKGRLGSGYTKPIKVLLNSAKIHYTNPVYLLTSHESASATEIMILSSLVLDHVTKIGSETEGVFSDILNKFLPNGWEFGLSNEVYHDTKGNNYEGIGIPADIDIAYSKNKQVFLSSIVEDLNRSSGDQAIEYVLKQN